LLTHKLVDWPIVAAVQGKGATVKKSLKNPKTEIRFSELHNTIGANQLARFD
jgi:DNA-binding GntR family transcriptional regulator